MGRSLLDFYKGKRVLLTGHTGFKGTWMSRILLRAGAKVTGYALEAPTEPSLYELLNLEVQPSFESIVSDVRDYEALSSVFQRVQPEIVFHLAAQPLVREGYKYPLETFQTNVMGTVNLMECVRLTNSVKSVINVTTDKVYENKEWPWGYRENEPLNGFDPYSNSKSCSDLATQSYTKSFFAGERDIAVSTVRAGNVIGGGDFALDRIIPDCVRAAGENAPIIVRNPHSTRPYQHVLEPVIAYMFIAMKQFEDVSLAGQYNIGPDESGCYSTGELVDMFCDIWGGDVSWIDRYDGGPHEASFLKLDCAKAKTTFGWKPCWSTRTAVEKTVEWSKAWLSGEDLCAVVDSQIDEYLCS